MKKLSTSFFMRAAIAIALLFASTGTTAAWDFMYNGLAYNYDGDGTSVYVTYTSTNSDNYGGSLSNVVIPAKITLEGNVSYNVTGIGQDAFRRCSNLQSITIPASVKTIGSDAFYDTNIKKLTVSSVDSWLKTSLNSVISTPHEMYVGSSLLTTVTIPSTVTNVGYHFMGVTSIKSVTIPNSVTEIGYSAFAGCNSLATLNLGSGVKTIGSVAFSGCAALTSVTFPVSLKTLGYRAFDNCTGLTSLTIPESLVTMDYAFSGCTNIKTLVWNAINLSSNGDIPTANIETVTIGNKVQTIPNNFLSNSKIKAVAFHSSVKTIGSSAFNGCANLTAVAIPNGCTVGSQAFANCSALQSVTIPATINVSNTNIFQNCNSIKKLTWNATNVSSQFVPTANIEQVTIGDGVTELPQYFLQNAKITSLSLPSSLTSIGSYAFQNCSGLSSLSLPSGLATIDSYAFQNCKGITTLTIPPSVKTIGESAFRDCNSLSYLNMGNGITTIGSHAFRSTYLVSVRIPESVTSVGQYTFAGCSRLKKVFVACDVNNLNNGNNFYNSPVVVTIGKPSWCNIHLDPNTSFEVDGITYVITDMVNRLVKIVDVDETKCASDIEVKKVKYRNVEFTPTELGTAALAGNYTVKSFKFGDVTVIPQYAFYVSALLKVEIPYNIVAIGQHAFENCKQMTEFVIANNGLNTIDQYVLAGCSSLRRVELGNLVATIYSNSFNGCNRIKTLRVNNAYPPNATSGVFNELDKWSCTLYVPKGTVDIYKNANEWKTFFFISDDETEPSSGDVNGDGKMNVSDVSALISMILGTTTMDEGAADVNGDGRVNVSDVSALINIILGIN